jgi:predicted anti-sigma-YlaC factor YlaD
MEERRILCERARSWAALAPDGELSTFEQRLLGAHLERCAECSAFAASVGTVTDTLRTAPLEPLPHPVAVSGLVWRHTRHLRPRRAVYSVAAAAAVVVFAASIGSAVSVSGGDRLVASPQIVVVPLSDDRIDDREMRQARRVSLVSDIPPQTSSRPHHFGPAAGM